jgi:acetate kinase
MYEFPYILTLNAGSSSLKAVFYALPSREVLHTICIEDIGLPVTRNTITTGQDTKQESLMQMEPREALNVLITFIEKHFSQEPAIIAHRIVHGGTYFTEPTKLTQNSLNALRTLTPLAPNHLPVQIMHLEQLFQTFTHATHVGCFDTAFHAHMPHLAQLTTLPRKYTDAGMKRYGFHGLSYEYIVETLRRRNILPDKLICAHLGNGASVCAIRAGVSIETSMGMTPASGVMMSTRSGDIDPGVVRFMNSIEPQSPEMFDVLTNKESGLKGVSGTTGDMRTLLENQAHDQNAKDAVDLFCYTVKKYIGAYTALLNGVDMIVFTGGIGERSTYIRNEICKNLEYIGLEMNSNAPDDHALLSTPTSKVRVEVMHTDENLMMYEHALHFLAL